MSNTNRELRSLEEIAFLKKENLSLRSTIDNLKKDNSYLSRQNEEILADAD